MHQPKLLPVFGALAGLLLSASAWAQVPAPGAQAPAVAAKNAAAPAPALAAPGKLTPLDDGATVLSADGKLIWMRCQLGQTYAQGNCTGSAKAMDQRDAENEIRRMNFTGGYAGSKAWRLPTAQELQSLVMCDQGYSGREKVFKTAAASVKLPDGCGGDHFLRPTLDPNIFPNASDAWVWTSSPDVDRVINMWAVNFGTGSPAPIGRHNNLTTARAVRTAP